MHLYLIRHGQSFVNLEDWSGGNQDVGLTELGQRQAAALAAWLPARLPQGRFVSDFLSFACFPRYPESSIRFR